MLLVTFRLDDGSKYRGEGWISVEYSSTSEEQKVAETTEDGLSKVFEDAKASGGTLDGADASIDAAIEDPLSFLDYLVLVDGATEFDDGYVRESPDGTTSA